MQDLHEGGGSPLLGIPGVPCLEGGSVGAMCAAEDVRMGPEEVPLVRGRPLYDPEGRCGLHAEEDVPRRARCRGHEELFQIPREDLDARLLPKLPDRGIDLALSHLDEPGRHLNPTVVAAADRGELSTLIRDQHTDAHVRILRLQ